jgi:hypothetical protein
MTINRRILLAGGIGVLGCIAAPALASPASLTAEDWAKLHLLLSLSQETSVRALGGGRGNYADPVTDPFGHFTLDVRPWIDMGAT